MTDKQLRDEIFTLFTAGHETTANALTFTWFLLARHPEAERLHEEVDRGLAGRAPTAADVERLPYARAVLSESMRLYPPAWIVTRQAKHDLEVAGKRIPAGGVVMMSQWVTHRDRRWWPQPDEFRPARWLSETDFERPRYAYFPFGGGPRSCIGEFFARMEATLIIAAVARHWRMERQDSKQPACSQRSRCARETRCGSVYESGSVVCAGHCLGSVTSRPTNSSFHFSFHRSSSSTASA